MTDKTMPDCWVVVQDGQITGTHDEPAHLNGVEAMRYVPAAEVEALQARVKELTENLEQKENGSLGRKFYEEMSYRLQRERDVEAAERDAALAKLKELESQPSPTALELMTEYSNGKQWAMEQAQPEPVSLTDEQIHALADRCTPKTETGALKYMIFARALLAAAKGGAL